MFWKMSLVGRLFLVGVMCVVFGQVNPAKATTRGVNGGVNCATCVVIVSLVEQVSEYHNESVVKALERLCSYLPGKYQQFCTEFAEVFGPILIQLISDDATPDKVCFSLDLCRTDPGRQTCHVFSFPSTAFEDSVKHGRDILSKNDRHGLWRYGINICDLPGIKEICLILESVFDNHFPIIDSDVDYFSTYPTMRGTSWRGQDCDDLNPDIHPGAVPIDSDRLQDSNCNGIYGTNPETLIPYESELCAGSQPRGILVLGDSISAHFHLPEEWFDATTISEAAFKSLDFIIENEIDWPEMSTVTGHGFNNWTEVIQGPIDSLYLRLWQRNHCNHRDYQNIAVNGADSHNMDNPIMESLARNQQKDQPLVVIYALVGNDVCNGYADDTFDHMTTPSEMKTNVMETLVYLDKRLPYNSTVFLVGLADGRVLYDSLKDRIHPIGRYWNKFTYSQFYDFFNCLQISPCSGWMNSNETIRNMTTERANELSLALQEVAQDNQKTFTHFQLYYMANPINKAISIWNAQGGQTWQLLEPVDGFHSNQYGQALTAQVVWEEAEKLVLQVFGPTNPANGKIEQIFGNQGGF